jgi:TM2 domain-containing membrane protein YozV
MTLRSDSPSPSVDANAIMMFEANKKSVGVAYVLWLFFGCFGGHRFYAGKTGSAIAQVLLVLIGWLTLVIGVGALLLVGLIVWVFVDAFLIPGWIRNLNSLLAKQMGHRKEPFQSSPFSHQEPSPDFKKADLLIARQLAERAQSRPTPPTKSVPGGFGKRGRS